MNSIFTKVKFNISSFPHLHFYFVVLPVQYCLKGCLKKEFMHEYFNRYMSLGYPFIVYYMKDVRFFCPFYIIHAIKFVFDTKRNSKEFLTPKKPFYT